jgi:hypothetical protein
MSMSLKMHDPKAPQASVNKPLVNQLKHSMKSAHFSLSTPGYEQKYGPRP